MTTKPSPKHRVRRWTPNQIRLLRLHCGMTQYEFADELAVQQVTVYRWECGRSIPRRMMTLLFVELAKRAGYPYPGEDT